MFAKEAIIDGILSVSYSENLTGYHVIKTRNREIGEYLWSGRIIIKCGYPVNRPTPSACSSDIVRIYKSTGKCSNNITGWCCQKPVTLGEIMKIIRILRNATALKINFCCVISNYTWSRKYICNIYFISSSYGKILSISESVFQSWTCVYRICTERKSRKTKIRNGSWCNNRQYSRKSKYERIYWEIFRHLKMCGKGRTISFSVLQTENLAVTGTGDEECAAGEIQTRGSRDTIGSTENLSDSSIARLVHEHSIIHRIGDIEISSGWDQCGWHTEFCQHTRGCIECIPRVPCPDNYYPCGSSPRKYRISWRGKGISRSIVLFGGNDKLSEREFHNRTGFARRPREGITESCLSYKSEESDREVISPSLEEYPRQIPTRKTRSGRIDATPSDTSKCCSKVLLEGIVFIALLEGLLCLTDRSERTRNKRDNPRHQYRRDADRDEDFDEGKTARITRSETGLWRDRSPVMDSFHMKHI